ncbi:MAG: AI-2E family transporter [Clostridium sp.]|nr:AI-2E family transporter [Clostridium sp.]MCM1172388.1 AI-2E family transporter [Clostridium sp.]MCM1209286.1 AI-2E family transporter [Ruminococcus sp.]
MSEKKRNIQTVLGIITFTVILIYLINHVSVIWGIIRKGISMIMPFLIGCGMAFVINIPMSGIEKSLFKNEDGKLYKYRRAISMVLAYMFAILVVVFVMFVVVPEVGKTIGSLGSKLEVFIKNVQEWIQKVLANHPDIAKQIVNELNNIEIQWDRIGSMVKDNGSSIMATTYTVFSSIIGAIVNIFIGLVFSIYILSQKEKLGKQTKMLCYSIFKENTADELMVFGKIANTTFAKFFTSQFREGIILGTMFAVVMAIIGMPYPLTIGVLIAFTALIPIFGAFIGLFIGSFLILIEEPKYVIWFIALFFILQFIENYFIYPKLVGGDIGLSAIWVLLAVLVGGDLMGVVGMLIFIPLVSVLYAYARSIIYRKLKKKEIDVDKKLVPDEAMPLMEGRHRLFARKAREKAREDAAKEQKAEEQKAEEQKAKEQETEEQTSGEQGESDV